MNICGPFHTNWDCFYNPKIEQVGCPRAAHSSFIGSSWWNRIPYLFPVSYSPKQNLIHIFQQISPNQFLDFTDCPKCPRKFPDQTAPSRPFSYQAYILMHNFNTSNPLNFWTVTDSKKNLKKIPTILFQVLGPIKRPLTASNQPKHRKTLK